MKKIIITGTDGFVGKNLKNKLCKLLKNHLIPLYENIIKETDMGED